MCLPLFDCDSKSDQRVGDTVIQCFTMFSTFGLKNQGFFEASLLLPKAKALLARYQAVSINEVKTPEAGLPRLQRVRAVSFYVAQPVKKIKYCKKTKSMDKGFEE